MTGVSSAYPSLDELRKWYTDYMTSDGEHWSSYTRRAVELDPEDNGFVNAQLGRAAAKTSVSRGFCNHCHLAFDNWPSLPSLGTRSSSHAIVRQFSTEQLEISKQKGCKCCALLWSLLVNRADLLSTFRRIEKRLAMLNQDATLSLSVAAYNDQQPQFLWLNHPGNITEDWSSPRASEMRFESRFALPSSKSIKSRTL